MALMAISLFSCSPQRKIIRRGVDGVEIEVDQEKVLENRVLWLVDNLEYQEGPYLVRNLQEIIKIGEPAVPALLDALRIRMPKIRANAAFALGEIKDDRALKPLEQHLRLDSNIDVRRECAQALLSFEKYQGVPLLIQTLRHRGNGQQEHSGLYKRYAAIQVLKHTFEHGDLGYVPNDPEPQREAAIKRWESWWAKNRSKYKH